MHVDTLTHAMGETKMEQYLNVKELGQALGVSRSTIYRLIECGLPYLKVGYSTRYSEKDVLAWLEADTRADVAGARPQVPEKGDDAEDVILQVGDYRCIGCGWIGHVEKERPLSGILCPKCETKSKVERV